MVNTNEVTLQLVTMKVKWEEAEEKRSGKLYLHQFVSVSTNPILSPQFSSVQFSHSVMSDSLRPNELQQARPPCPSPTAGVYPNSCPLSRWCHPAISSSVVPFSSCLQSLPASRSFPMSQLFTWGGIVPTSTLY